MEPAGSTDGVVTHTALIRFAPVFSTEQVLDPALVVRGRTLYQAGSLTLEGEVPVLVDHDHDRPIGLVHELLEHTDADGSWHAALVSLDESVPGWVKRGSAASFAIATVERQQIGDTTRVLRGLVFEVSVLSPGVKPAEPLAQVLTIRRTEATPAVDDNRPTLLVRPSIGQVLGVR
jgi:hypothetical protein